MLWRTVKLKNNLIVAGTAGAFLLVLFLMPQPAGAVSTEIGVAVCGPDATGAQITITQPLNDSVQEQAITTFRGTVTSASQIEVFIDESIDRTVAIGANQTDFAFDVTFTPGTHTVLLRANDICGVLDGEASIVMTYEPVTAPSNGSTTPTQVAGETTLDGQPVTSEPIAENNLAQNIDQVPIVGPAVNSVLDFMRAIGFEATVTSSGDKPTLVGVARVAVTVTALTSIVLAGTLAPVALANVPGISELFTASSHRSMLYLEWAIRGIGVLALAMAYFI